jgi:hypothetical protein
MSKPFGVIAACLLVIAASAPANASLIVTLVSATPVSGGTDYTYNLTLSSDEQLDPSVSPVFFTLYDFGQATMVGETGFLANGEWSFVCDQIFTTYAMATQPNANPGLDGMRAIFNGPETLPTSFGTNEGNLGTFTIFTTATDGYSAVPYDQDAQLEKYTSDPGTNDTPTSNLSTVDVPNVPEPATLGVFGVGLLGFTLMRRKLGRA